MSSTGTPTSNLGLNQWLPNDKPERVDFNRDNQKIEAAMDNKVTKGTPLKFDLELQDGFVVAAGNSYESVYFRSQENRVTIEFGIGKEDQSTFGTGTITVATVPEGFRPSYIKHNTGYCDLGEGAYVYVNTAGQLRIRCASATTTKVFGEIGYYVS